MTLTFATTIQSFQETLQFMIMYHQTMFSWEDHNGDSNTGEVEPHAHWQSPQISRCLFDDSRLLCFLPAINAFISTCEVLLNVIPLPPNNQSSNSTRDQNMTMQQFYIIILNVCFFDWVFFCLGPSQQK